MATVTALYHDLEIVVPESTRTLSGYRAWATSDDFPQRGQISYINGEVLVDMRPERFELHMKVKAEIAYVITAICKATRAGTYCSDGTLLSNEDAGLCTEPDGAFVSHDSFRSGRVRLVPIAGDEDLAMEIEGTPDWVCEVVSDSSVRKDNVLLRRAYHLAGIPEYWLVDARHDDVSFMILIHQPGGYVAAEVRDGGQTSPVFDRQFQLRRERNAIGHWDYTMLERPVS